MNSTQYMFKHMIQRSKSWKRVEDELGQIDMPEVPQGFVHRVGEPVLDPVMRDIARRRGDAIIAASATAYKAAISNLLDSKMLDAPVEDTASQEPYYGLEGAWEKRGYEQFGEMPQVSPRTYRRRLAAGWEPKEAWVTPTIVPGADDCDKDWIR